MVLNVLSLFDGLGGTYQALKSLDIPINKYYASEIDKYAISIARKTNPKMIELGDVTKITPDMIKEPIDLMVWGSPCQDLSVAKQGRKGLQGERSGLFFTALELYRTIKPKYFLMENVASMKKEDMDIISGELGVTPILINSAKLTAQQRKRLYWTNIPNITDPDNKHILLKDILEKNVDPKYFLSEKLIYNFVYRDSPFTGGKFEPKDNTTEDKAVTLTARYYKMGITDNYIYDSEDKEGLLQLGGIMSNQRQYLAEKRKFSQANRVYSVEGKSPSLVANGGGLGAKTGLYLIEAPNGKVMEIDPSIEVCAFKEVRTEEGKRKRAEIRQDTGLDTTKRSVDDKKYIPQTTGKSNCITTSPGIEGLVRFKDKIRRLTPTECERLQGIPDGFTSIGINDKNEEVVISDTQRYKVLGNGFTVPVIAHILSFMLKNGESKPIFKPLF